MDFRLPKKEEFDAIRFTLWNVFEIVLMLGDWQTEYNFGRLTLSSRRQAFTNVCATPSISALSSPSGPRHKWRPDLTTGFALYWTKAIRQSGGEKSRESAVFMAIGMYFSPASLSAEKYDEVIGLLEKAGAGNPAGRSYHAAFGPDDKLAVFEVWESQAAFEEFGKTLMPILQQLGIDPGTPAVMPIHKVTVPAANGASPGK